MSGGGGSSSSSDYADGGVHSLTQGSGELTTILQEAARRNQLVLVDFSASWCGPCKMMLPVLQQLAAEHRGRLAVVKVDCEQTAANQGLAQSSGIRAFPTFHLYRDRQKVDEQRGANPGGLRQAIQRQLALLGPADGSGGGGGQMVTSLAAALGRVKAGCSFDEFVAAAKTLLTFVGNAIDHLCEDKYRRVKLSNAGFQSKLGCRAGGKECMAAIGFRELMEAGETVLLLPEVPQELPRVRQLLQQALQQAEAAAGAAAAAAQRRAQAGAGAAGPVAGAAAAAGAGAAPAAGLGSSSTGAAAGTAAAEGPTVDPTALARALAAALGGGGAGAAATPVAAAAPAASAAPRPAAALPAGTSGAGARAGVPAGRPRTLRVTPAMLAKALGSILADSGIAPPPQQQQQEEKQEQPPAAEQQ